MTLSSAMFSMPYACGGRSGPLEALFFSLEFFSLGLSPLGLFSWHQICPSMCCWKLSKLFCLSYRILVWKYGRCWNLFLKNIFLNYELFLERKLCQVKGGGGGLKSAQKTESTRDTCELIDLMEIWFLLYCLAGVRWRWKLFLDFSKNQQNCSG